MIKKRLDLLLVERYNIKSRTNAQSLIKSGAVKVNDGIEYQASKLINLDSKIELLDSTLNKYVSRGGLKLEYALKTFKVDVKDKIALDIGASTGGFTDCLLKHGAKFIYALDVGSNQLDNSLIKNPKVLSLEKINFRDFNFEKLNHKLDIITIDVSFISLDIIIENLAKNIELYQYQQLTIIALIKPEFELFKKALNNQGLVKSKALQIQALSKVFKAAEKYRLKLVNYAVSPLLGSKAGNQEYLGLFQYKRTEKNDKITNVVDFKRLELEDNNDSTNNH